MAPAWRMAPDPRSLHPTRGAGSLSADGAHVAFCMPGLRALPPCQAQLRGLLGTQYGQFPCAPPSPGAQTPITLHIPSRHPLSICCQKGHGRYLCSGSWRQAVSEPCQEGSGSRCRLASVRSLRFPPACLLVVTVDRQTLSALGPRHSAEADRAGGAAGPGPSGSGRADVGSTWCLLRVAPAAWVLAAAGGS